MTDVEGLYVNIGADVSALPRALGTAEQRIDQFARRADSSLAKADASFTRLNAAVSQSAQLLGVYLGIDVAARVIAAADAWNLSASKIALYTASVQEAAAVQELLFEAAQRSRSAMQPTVGLYTSLADAMLGMGKNQGEVVRVTETVAKTFKISGTEAGAASGAITQLSQALASGVLRGDEFNSVMEASPRLAKAMAEGLGVPRGALKGLAEQGALTADKVVNALLRQSAVIDGEFGKVAVTVADAWTAVGNAVQREIGRLDQAFGVTDSLSSDLLTLADNMHGAMLAGFGLLATIKAVEIARMVPAGGQALLRFVDDLKVATYARAAATAEAAAADKAAAAAELVRTQQARGIAATTASYTQAEVQRRVAIASAATATLAAAENELTAAKAKSLYATNVYTSAQAIARETEVQLAATMAREASISADQQKAAALGRLAAANTVLAGATETVAVANAGLTASAIRAEAATATLGKSIAASTVAFNVARAVGSNMLAFVGGPMGAAFLAAAGAVGVLAFHTTAAERAGDAFADAQRATQAALKDTTSDVDGLVKQYSRLSDSMRAVTLMRMEEAMAKQRDAIIAARRAVELSAATSGNSPFRIVEGNHGADNLTDVRAFEAMGLSAAQVERLRLAFDNWRASAPDDARALGLLMQSVYGIGKEAGDAGASLLAFARQNAEVAEGAEKAGEQIETTGAHMALLRNPADAAAKAVLDAGQRASGAAGEFARMSGAVGSLTGKLADLTARAALLSMPVGFARKVAEITGPAPEVKTPVVTGFQDRRSSDDDVAYQQHQSGAAATAVVLTRTSTAELKERTAEEQRRTAANRLLAGALTDTAKAEAQNRVELSKAALEYPGLGEATSAAILTTKDFGATLSALPPELQALWKQMGASSAAQLSGEFAQLAAQTSLETASTIRLADAYGQGAAAVEAANRQIEIETRLLKLGEGARGQVTAMVNAEADARQRLDMAKWVAETDAQMAAARRLADAEAKGGAAVAEANVQNKIAEELTRQRIGTGTKEAGVIEAKIRALEGENRARRAAAELGSANDDLAYARAELALMGQTEQARDRALVSLRNQQQAARLAGEIGVEAAQRWLATQEQIADTHALKAYADAVRQTADTIATDWAETLFDAMTLQDKSASILDAIKALLRRIALEFLKTRIVLPVVTQVVGSASGLFGISAPATGAGTSGMLGQAGSIGMNWASGKALSWAGDQIGVGSLYNGALNWAGGALGLGTSSAAVAGAADLTAVAAGDAVMAAWGGGGTTAAMEGAGAAAQTMAVGAGDAAMASGGGLTSAGSALGGYLGAAGAGAAGGYLGGLLGTATNSKAVGGLSGAALGAGASALAAYMGLGAMGGPVGLAIGAVVGGIMGMLGTQKASVGPNSRANLTLDGGVWKTGDAAADNGGDLAKTRGVTDAIAVSLNALMSAVGIKNDTLMENVAAISLMEKDGRFTTEMRGKKKDFSDQASALTSMFSDLLQMVMEDGATEFTNQDNKVIAENVRAALNASIGKPVEEVISNLTFAATDFAHAYDSVGKAAGDQFSEQLTTLSVGFQEARDRAAKLGLTTTGMSDSFEKATNRMIDAASRALKGLPVDAINAAMESWRKNAVALMGAGLDPAPAMRLLGQQLESILVSAGAGIDGLQKLIETAAILRDMGEDTGALWASTRAEHVRAAVNQDLSMRELAAKVALGQASQAAYDMAELEIRQRQELADVTDAAVRARLIEVQATEKAVAVAKAAAQATAELTAKQQALISAGGDTRKWLDQRAGTASTSVSPEEALQAAQAQFARDLSLARGGDADASRRITDTADRLLAATDAVHASGAEYQAMERWVTSSIAGLPATVSYDQQILAALRELGGSVNVQVELATVRTITESLNALSEEERNRLTQTAVILRTVEERLGQLLSPADLARLVDAELVTRDVQQVLGRDLSSVERDALVAGGAVIRSVEQAIGRALTAAEVATLIQGGTVDRSIVQAMGRTLTTAETAALVQSGEVIRSISQFLGRDLSFSEADALVVGGAVVRTVGQYLGRDLTVEERAGLVAAARVIRTVEQQLGRPLTDAEQAAIILPASVTRTIGQTVTPATGSTLITSGTETKTVKQSVETTETVQISRSMDDKLSGILTAIKVATEASSKLLESVRSLVERAVDGDGLMVRTRPTSDPRSWVAFEQGGVIPGYAGGGTVANGVRGKDSVLARYPDGRPIWLAGGEFVTPEPAVTPETYPVLEYIRQHHALPPPASGYEAGGIVAPPRGFADLDSRVPVPRRLIEAPAAVAARLDVQPVVGAINALTVVVGRLREDVVDLGRADHEQRAALSGAVDRRLVAMADVLDTVARRVGGR